MKRNKWIIIIVVVAALIAVIGWLGWRALFSPTSSTLDSGTISKQAEIKRVAENLKTPWSISFLPDGDMLISERSGQLQRIGESGKVILIQGVRETSEGGLLGIALHPDFAENNRLYMYYTTERSGRLTNQIDQAQFTNNTITEQQTIIDDIPAASNHNGGAIEFGPDKKLYITTGDAAEPQLAQDTNSLAGKILRVNDDGSTPNDNPFDNLVWSYGHRNPQGLAWDDRGRLWSVEHGPSGMEAGRDELNLIEKGANYGWPIITGNEKHDGMKSPVVQSGDDETWAPARMVHADGKLYFTGLRGQSLYQGTIEGDKVTLKRYLVHEYGRLRAINFKDDLLYVGTSNRDGRGSPSRSDDIVLSIPIENL